MAIEMTPLQDAFIFIPKVFGDERGYFFESFNQQQFEDESGISGAFVQDNQARSVKNVLRGLHFQYEPYAQAKLVRVLHGSIWDVIVDIRKSSPTYGQWFGIELSEENHKQLFVPKGFAHGYSVLSDSAEVFYKCDAYYHKEAESGILYHDPALAIDWKISLQEAIVSGKDREQDSWMPEKCYFQ